MSACPSRVALEQFLLTPAAVPTRAHIEGCALCQQKLVEMRAVGDEFHARVYPASVQRILRSLPQPRPRRTFQLGWLVPVGALGAVLLAFQLRARAPAGPGADYVGTKGAAVRLRLFVESGDGQVLEAQDGDRVPASARWRSRVHAGAACRWWVFSVDAQGAVSRIFPASGEPGGRVPPSGEVPGGAQLDGVAGPERVVAICGPDALGWTRLEAAARHAFQPASAERVRTVREVGELPAGVQQASLLLEKGP